jgi:hypothetical protein
MFSTPYTAIINQSSICLSICLDLPLLTPHISGHNLLFYEAWTTLNVVCVVDLTENGHWKQIRDFNTDHCTIPTIRRLAANLKPAEALFRHHYPNLPLQINCLKSPSPFYATGQPNGQLTPLPIPRKTTYRKFLLLTSNEHVTVNGQCHWQMGTPELGGSLSPPYPQQRQRYRLEIITQQNRHTKTATPMD